MLRVGVCGSEVASLRDDLVEKAAKGEWKLPWIAEREKAKDQQHKQYADLAARSGNRLTAGGFGPFGGLSGKLATVLRNFGATADAEADCVGDLPVRVTILGSASLIVQAEAASSVLRLRRRADLDDIEGRATRWGESKREARLREKAESDRELEEMTVDVLRGTAQNRTGGGRGNRGPERNGSEVGARFLSRRVPGSNPAKKLFLLGPGFPLKTNRRSVPSTPTGHPAPQGSGGLVAKWKVGLRPMIQIDPAMGRQGSASIGKGLATLGRRAISGSDR